MRNFKAQPGKEFVHSVLPYRGVQKQTNSDITGVLIGP